MVCALEHDTKSRLTSRFPPPLGHMVAGGMHHSNGKHRRRWSAGQGGGRGGKFRVTSAKSEVPAGHLGSDAQDAVEFYLLLFCSQEILGELLKKKLFFLAERSGREILKPPKSVQECQTPLRIFFFF